MEQNTLHDAFLTIIGTKDDLDGTSFLSALDMDPSADAGALFGGLTSPAPTPDTGAAGNAAGAVGDKREVFSDFKRFVTFAVRRDREQRQ